MKSKLDKLQGLIESSKTLQSDWKLIRLNAGRLLVCKILLSPVPVIQSSVLIDERLKTSYFHNSKQCFRNGGTSDGIGDIFSEVEQFITSPESLETPLTASHLEEVYIESNDVKVEVEYCDPESFLKSELSEEKNLVELEEVSFDPAPEPPKLTKSGKKVKSKGIRALRTCDLCGFNCYYKPDMTQHMIRIHFTPTILCCGKLWNEAKLTTHRRIKHRKDKSCDICGHRFGFNNSLKQHMVERHGQKGEYVCSHCDRDFAIQSHLKHHLSEVHGESSARYLCDICGAEYMSPSAISMHKRAAHVEGRDDDSKRHIKKKLPGESRKKNFLNAKFAKVNWSKEIVPISLSDVPAVQKTFKCDICPFSYDTDAHLKRHYSRIHDPDARKHVCSQCYKAYLTNYELKLHVRTVHTFNEARQCPLCNNVHKTKSAMRKHLLWSHTASHYICECGQMAKLPKTMKKHLKDVHNIDASTRTVISMKVEDESGTKENLKIFEKLYKNQ